ncbi:hypothetical protein Adeh_1849 [Anaeromyxobacter dehalogenans 2CP-C]|uniref:Uncharacterized protein n=1 Tax=Anaeromyxobacter dehalogenans (strain 2CP-C) TaxID=290397 RepID=Q2IIZ0_ANADE|nr:hypothetical protein Adeh_1849 [Anaeromyxobacter dehalogenans 2CP-C]
MQAAERRDERFASPVARERLPSSFAQMACVAPCAGSDVLEEPTRSARGHPHHGAADGTPRRAALPRRCPTTSPAAPRPARWMGPRTRMARPTAVRASPSLKSRTGAIRSATGPLRTKQSERSCLARSLH